jgi:hypothetical protein
LAVRPRVFVTTDASGAANVLLIERETEDQIAPGLAVGVKIERAVDTAFEGIVQDEIEAMQMFEHVSLDVAANEIRIGSLETVRCQRLLEEGKVRRVIDPDVDVRSVALVAGTGMRNVAYDSR